MILVNMKLDISGCNRITLQGCRYHWSIFFHMAQLKLAFSYYGEFLKNPHRVIFDGLLEDLNGGGEGRKKEEGRGNCSIGQV